MTSPFEREKNIHDDLLKFLKANPKGLITTEIEKATKISRKTLEKHLQILVFENEIYMKQFGPTRVYYPNHRIHYLDFEKFIHKNRTIWFDILENEYGEYLVIQEKRKNDKEWEAKGSILIPIEGIEGFIKALSKIKKSDKLKKIVKESKLNPK